jgi:hypothetical protein
MASWQGMSRRGRPKMDRPEVDKGTPEQQARRLRLSAGSDPVLTEHPLGILLARHLITGEQHEAGCYYAYLYRRTIGTGQVSCGFLYQQVASIWIGSEEVSDTTEARIESLFRLGKNRLLAAGRRLCDAVENVAVFGRIPRFMNTADRRPGSARRADSAELEAVRLGLDVLVACYGRAAGRTGRMEEHRAPSMAANTGTKVSLDKHRKIVV